MPLDRIGRGPHDCVAAAPECEYYEFWQETRRYLRTLRLVWGSSGTEIIWKRLDFSEIITHDGVSAFAFHRPRVIDAYTQGSLAGGIFILPPDYASKDNGGAEYDEHYF